MLYKYHMFERPLKAPIMNSPIARGAPGVDDL
jgi:hypothetical protein